MSSKALGLQEDLASAVENRDKHHGLGNGHSQNPRISGFQGRAAHADWDLGLRYWYGAPEPKNP